MAPAPCSAETWRPFVLGADCFAPHATYPDGGTGNSPEGCPSCHPYSVLLPVGFAVPLLLPVARWALTPPFHPCRAIRLVLADEPSSRRFAFCGTFPGVAPAGHYPAPYFHGARTFLTSGLSAIAGAAARPADAPYRGAGRSKGNRKNRTPGGEVSLPVRAAPCGNRPKTPGSCAEPRGRHYSAGSWRRSRLRQACGPCRDTSSRSGCWSRDRRAP
jgi:hypothetical protein